MHRPQDSEHERESGSSGSGEGAPLWYTVMLIVAALILAAFMVFYLQEGRYWRALSWACFLAIAVLTSIGARERRSLAIRLRRPVLAATFVMLIFVFVARR